jgi:nucleotide-binding universal stress UspA family protein
VTAHAEGGAAPVGEPDPVREILLATDFSEIAETAAVVARQQAVRWGARVHVLHVTDPGDTGGDRLGRIAAGLAPIATMVRTMVAHDPARAIVAYASSHAIDLIVIGTHGRSGFSQVLLGSVAERVVRTAPCPVLTVPVPVQKRPVAVATAPAPRGCLVCSGPTDDLVCARCRARIRGEALERKQKDERVGRA